MKIFTISGWSGSGKTLLITRLIERFKARNRRVVAVKHAPNSDSMQPEGKDSRRFLEAGADEVFLLTARELTRIRTLGNEEGRFGLLTSCFRDEDIVLMEGFHQEGIPVIEVVDARINPETRLPVERLAAVVSDPPLVLPIPCFSINEVDRVADFMEGCDEKHH
jgi:molybdopterin-guanine dinucleotide biosynthesis protein B